MVLLSLLLLRLQLLLLHVNLFGGAHAAVSNLLFLHKESLLVQNCMFVTVAAIAGSTDSIGTSTVLLVSLLVLPLLLELALLFLLLAADC